MRRFGLFVFSTLFSSLLAASDRKMMQLPVEAGGATLDSLAGNLNTIQVGPTASLRPGAEMDLLEKKDDKKDKKSDSSDSESDSSKQEDSDLEEAAKLAVLSQFTLLPAASPNVLSAFLAILLWLGIFFTGCCALYSVEGQSKFVEKGLSMAKEY